jgi:hypothetical protein
VVRWFDPNDLIQPLGPHDRQVRDDGQGAVIWLQGLHAEGVAIGFEAMELLAPPPGPTGPELDLPRMTVTERDHRASIPCLRGKINSVDGRIFRFRGTYYVKVSDPSAAVTCSVEFLDVELRLVFALDQLG